jgi:glucose-6-phosphate isomerase
VRIAANVSDEGELARLARHSFYHQELGFSLDFSRIGFDARELRVLEPRVALAFQQMDALEAGGEANRDEHRMVGHYWLRAPERAPAPEIAEAISSTLGQVVDLARRVHDCTLAPPRGGRFGHAIVIGIGGSALGPQLLDDALRGDDAPVVVHFADNTDPDGIDRLLGRIGAALEHSVAIVISKSGGTKETKNGMLEIEQAFHHAGLDFARHAIAVTQADSELDRHAQKSGFLARLPMWDWVGGRTSVTSAVGLLPAALAGIDVRGLLAGAAEMDRITRRHELFANPAAILAACWYALGNGRGERAMVVLPYKDRLQLFARYLQQLVMESLGKREDRSGQTVMQGLSVYGNKGSTDQHAYVQQLLDGRDDFFATFVEVARDRVGASILVEPGVTSGDYLWAFLQGTRRALTARGRASLTLSFAELDARSLGALIALYERAVGLYAELIDVNAYHQPAVESGKRAARELLALQQAAVAALPTRVRAAKTARELADDIGASDSEGIYLALRHLAANGRASVTDGHSPVDARFWTG